jgi:hypothetical protein
MAAARKTGRVSMGSAIGWGLAVLAVALGYAFYGWQGVAVAISGAVFWLLLQFSRAMRAMRVAGQSPVGTVASAVMLQARLRPGLRLMDIIVLTRSLGRKVADEPETFEWCDGGGACVRVTLVQGRCSRWQLLRPADDGVVPDAEPRGDAA